MPAVDRHVARGAHDDAFASLGDDLVHRVVPTRATAEFEALRAGIEMMEVKPLGFERSAARDACSALEFKNKSFLFVAAICSALFCACIEAWFAVAWLGCPILKSFYFLEHTSEFALLLA
jgi:hypothetical protein